MGMAHLLAFMFMIYTVDRGCKAETSEKDFSKILKKAATGLGSKQVINNNNINSNSNKIGDKNARDIINSFVNAWKSSSIIPNYGINKPGHVRSFRKFGSFDDQLPSLDKLDFLAPHKSKIDKQSLFALQNSLDPKPIRRHVRKPDHAEARTYFAGGDHLEDNDESPELKLATLVSKPIYHNIPGGNAHESDQDYKEFMFQNNEDTGDSQVGLPNDDWRASRRSDVEDAGNTVRLLAIGDDGGVNENKARKRHSVLNIHQLEDIIRHQRNEIPSSARRLIEQEEVKRILGESGDKKEMITDPYNFISLPVSDAVKSSPADRKFYKSVPDKFADSFYREDEPPSEFKLQKKNLWGEIEKRWRRNRIAKRKNVPETVHPLLRHRKMYVGLDKKGVATDDIIKRQFIPEPLHNLLDIKPYDDFEDDQRGVNKRQYISEPVHRLTNSRRSLYDGLGEKQWIQNKIHKIQHGLEQPESRPNTKPSIYDKLEEEQWANNMNKRGHIPRYRQFNAKRSMFEGLGESGDSFDAYGSIGQDMAPSLMKLTGDRNEESTRPCKESSQMTSLPSDLPYQTQNSVSLMDNSQIQQNLPKSSESGVIQLAPEEPQRRSGVKLTSARGSRMKRAVIMLKKKLLEDALSKKGSQPWTVKDTLAKTDAPSSRSRSIHSRYLGGLPDSRGTENEDGITEDAEQEGLEEKLAHDSTPLVMKIAQHDGSLLHKYWSNKHSPGNGFYTGHGEGPNHAYLGDYFGHSSDEIERDEGVQSLENSPSSEDHHTASLIDSIWEHDLGDDHLGEHRVEGQHAGSKIKSYFGGHHTTGILLPTETMDGIDTHWTGHMPHHHTTEYEHEGHPVDFSPSRIKAIQAIQDDPVIDAELDPQEGIGTPMRGHGGHHVQPYHTNAHYGGMNLAPVSNEPVQVEDSHEEEYKQHIDNLLSQYHGLEEHLRGTAGTLAGHLDEANFAHHGHHHLHTGYDLYAYKNPWDNMRIPYHVPVINHPSGDQEEAPPSPLTFEGKTDEKGGPVVEGGKEEGGKGGPFIEGPKISTIKESKEDKGGESPKGAKASGGKSPEPVIPKQRGGPDVSSGTNSTSDSKQTDVTSGANKTSGTSDNKQSGASESKQSATSDKQTGASDEKQSTTDATSGKQEGTKSADNKEGLVNAESKSASSDKESNEDKTGQKSSDNKSESKDAKEDNKEKAGSNLSEMVENMINSSGKQSEMLNNLNAALGEQTSSLTAMQVARLKQLGALQQALLTSLAKQALQAPKEAKPDSAGSEMNEMKQLLELQGLQQLGAGNKASSLINTIRQNSLLHSLKAAQEKIMRNAKIHSSMKEAANNNNKHDSSKTTASEIQSFFGKLPIDSSNSDLSDVASEKIASRLHAASENDVTEKLASRLHSPTGNEITEKLASRLHSPTENDVTEKLASKLHSAVDNAITEKLASKLRPVSENDVSEKLASKLRSSSENDASVSEMIRDLELAHAKKSAQASKAEAVKNSLGNLLSEKLFSNLRSRQAHKSRGLIDGSTNRAFTDSISSQAYSTIGNEGPSATEVLGHTRTTHAQDKKKGKQQKKHKKMEPERERNETGEARAGILSHDDDKIDEDELSKKTEVKKT